MIIIFVILFLCWIIWSGMFDAFHLLMGIISSGIVTILTYDILLKGKKISPRHIVIFIRFIKYIPWLLYQIILANIYVAYLVLHPKMPIEPRMIKYQSRLKKDIPLTILANSITLTPGTITADIKNEEYHVHCLSRKSAEGLLSGDMEKKVVSIFDED